MFGFNTYLKELPVFSNLKQQKAGVNPSKTESTLEYKYTLAQDTVSFCAKERKKKLKNKHGKPTKKNDSNYQKAEDAVNSRKSETNEIDQRKQKRQIRNNSQEKPPKKYRRDDIKIKYMSNPAAEKYINILSQQLKSTPNSDFIEKLSKIPGIYSQEKAEDRIASLSRYLKEDMVGFYVPEYEVKVKIKKVKGETVEQKGGYQWFERSLEYLLRGSKKGTDPSQYKNVAKELFGLLSTHDNYWKSQEFIDYLSTLQQSDARDATIAAIEELQKGIKDEVNISFTSLTPLVKMEKLLNDGCAYSGVKLIPNHIAKPDEPEVSVEHILPCYWGGPFDDANYLLVTRKINSVRSSIGLIDFLKGKDANTPKLK
ncbi:MAG: hypothetical protein A2255_10450 [Candidatus Melainabacteria bacterium RIFOXYA2_FULL_32_9]|nr:MAG: hypothetical protein A2255_10450 [Candidatus Melainabacteria bacterium RIFOXYA2_FULL_32_9]